MIECGVEPKIMSLSSATVFFLILSHTGNVAQESTAFAANTFSHGKCGPGE